MIGEKSEESPSRPALMHIGKTLSLDRWTNDKWIWTMQKGMVSNIVSVITANRIASKPLTLNQCSQAN